MIFYSGGETVESSCEGFKSSEQQKDGEVKQKRGKKERMKARKLEIKRGERVSKKKERRENTKKGKYWHKSFSLFNCSQYGFK